MSSAVQISVCVFAMACGLAMMIFVDDAGIFVGLIVFVAGALGLGVTLRRPDFPRRRFNEPMDNPWDREGL